MVCWICIKHCSGYQQHEYEQSHEKIATPAALFQLVTQHQSFAWLRTLSELIVRVDVFIESALPDGTQVKSLIDYTKKLLIPNQQGNDFAKQFLLRSSKVLISRRYTEKWQGYYQLHKFVIVIVCIRFKRSVSPILFAGNLIIILYIWWNGSGQGLTNAASLSSPLIALGTLCGLLAFYFALWQLMLIGRIPFVERPWGHDKLSRLHHFLGLTAISILIFHPLFLTLGYSKLAETTFVSQLWTFIISFPDVWRAAIAYVMFLLIILITLIDE